MSKNGDIVIISRKMCCNTTGVIRLIYNYSTGFFSLYFTVYADMYPSIYLDIYILMHIYIDYIAGFK